MKTLLNANQLFNPISSRLALPVLTVTAVGLALLIMGLLVVEVYPPPAPATLSARSGILFVTPTPPGQPVRRPPEQPVQTAAIGPMLLAPAIEYYKDANEMGKVMVLEYHRIAYPESRYQRTPDNFRADLQRLVDSGYYPVNFIDLIQGLKEVPPGKKPVVLTFDDSDMSQFWVMDDRTVDADSAVGILLNFHEKYREDWPLRATFFVLGDDTAGYSKLFGQPQWAKQKLKVLVDLGMEIGSHTVNHTDLSAVSGERLAWELAISKHVVEELVPGYTVQTMSVPYGGFPWSTDLLAAGNWGDYYYAYAGNAAAWGGPSISPFDPEFDPYRVSRLEVSEIWIDHWLTYFEQNPDEYYVSDGDPGRLTFPEAQPETELAAER